MNRKFKRSFGIQRNVNHKKPNFWGSVNLIYHFVKTFTYHLPVLLKLKIEYQNRIPNKRTRVLMYSDNLDEINGISINSRELVTHLRKKGHDIYLVGTAFHKTPMGRREKNGTILLPQIFSLDQYGYEDSEMAIPSLSDLIKAFKRLPPDLIEIETPASGAALVTVAARIIGIPVIQHYRTDMFAYIDKLKVNRFETFFTQCWIKALCKITYPILVPSEDFKDKIHRELNIPLEKIIKIRRGINMHPFLESSHNQNLWKNYSTKNTTTRFLFVGRVCKMKNLDFFENVWTKFRKLHSNVELMIIGDGPYLSELKNTFKSFDEVYFTGKLSHDTLIEAYQHSHFFVLPSGTETFGNVIVEALASGLPTLVSNFGGPRDIVCSNSYGEVISLKNENAWIDSLSKHHLIKQTSPNEYLKMKEAARNRSKDFSLDESSKAFWNLFEKIVSDKKISTPV